MFIFTLRNFRIFGITIPDNETRDQYVSNTAKSINLVLQVTALKQIKYQIFSNIIMFTFATCLSLRNDIESP